MKPSDRRRAYRYAVQILLRIRAQNKLSTDETVETVNLSEQGVYFVTNYAFLRGTVVQLVLEMPSEVTGVSSTLWKCVGRVVHTELVTSEQGNLGVGVRFDYYEILPSAKASL